MRIALVVEQVDRRKGGAETSVGEFVEHIAAAGVEVCCLTCGGQAGKDGRLEVRPVRARSGPRWWWYKKYLETAAQVARKGRFDLVHAIVPCEAADIYQPRGGTIPETMARNLAMSRPGLRRSVRGVLQRLTLKQQVMLDAERRLLGGMRQPVVACVSNYVAWQVRQHYRLPGPKVRVIFNGVNPDPADDLKRGQDRRLLRRQWEVDDQAVVFATVAHNFRLKGVHRFLEAAALVRSNDRPVALLIAGRGTEGPYRRLARRLGLAGAVRFTGPLPDIWGLYHAADACVLASYYDPCSRAVLEALTAGLPCVTTRYNGASDVVDEGHNGYVIDSPDDVAALADRMTLLLDDDRRARLGQAGRQLRDDLSMARHAREMLVLYEEVVRKKTSRV
jgi:UDP-glucose:(heptosyl)LPS alpha-1,3-glucosyltransferase